MENRTETVENGADKKMVEGAPGTFEVPFGVSAEAEPDSTRSMRSYVLMDAAMCGKWRNVKALLSAGCDVDSVDEGGWGALMHVVNEYDASDAESYKMCLSLLLEAGCDIEAKDYWDETAESCARKLGNHELGGMIASERERRALAGALAQGDMSPKGGSLRV